MTDWKGTDNLSNLSTLQLAIAGECGNEKINKSIIMNENARHTFRK